VGSTDVTLTVTATAGTLTAGTYTGHINVNALKYCSTPTPAAVGVTLTLEANSPLSTK